MTRNQPDPEAAEAIAIEALGFIAADQKLLPRFLSITGIEAHAIRAAAREPGFLAGVLDFVLAHEPTLMEFCEANGRNPASIVAARRKLAGDDGSFEASI